MGFFGFGNYSKPGKGISKDDVEKRRFIIFFEVVTRKFWKLVQLSLLYTVVSLPALIIYFLISALIVPGLLIINLGETAVADMSNYIFLFSLVSAAFLLLLLGSGPASCGASYILRNFSREEHSWVFSDFFEHFRKNFKQGMALFLINLLVLSAVCFNILFYSSGMDAGMPGALKILLISALTIWCIIYFIMQFYAYPMIVTFNLKVTQILKNSLLFAIYKLPQNLVLLIFTAGIFGIFVYMGELAPVLYGFIPALAYSFILLIQLFYTFPVITGAMIQKEECKEKGEEEERTFEDTV